MTAKLPDPSLPLKNKTHEAFAQNRAAGQTAQRAWQLASRPHDPDSLLPTGARSSAHRAGKRPEIAARIVHLRQQRAGGVDWADSTPSQGELSDLMHKITDAFVNLYEAAERGGAMASDLTKIKRATTLHVGRAERLSDLTPPPPAYEGTKVDLTGPLARLFLCECER